MTTKYLVILAAAAAGWFVDPMLAFIILLSLGDAKIELAIEVNATDPQPNSGWAKNLKCWRADPNKWYAKLWRCLLGSHKPMTAYHAWRLPTLIFFFHLPFFFGTPWTLAGEFKALFWFVLYGTLEDYLWFFLHPSYGVKGFISEGRAGKIYWMPKFFGPFPVDYYLALIPLVILKCLAVNFA